MHISANHFDLLQFNAKCVSNPKRDSPQEMSIITLKGPPNIPKLKANSYTTSILKKGLLIERNCIRLYISCLMPLSI